jgi:ubiquinone/menaquinone biosynthesis C-methylase UbiE
LLNDGLKIHAIYQEASVFLLRFLFRILIGNDRWQFFESLDWETASDRFRQPNLEYPDYYSSQNFHGISGGYLNAIAAITYDTVAAFASPPSDTWIRQQLLTSITGQPQTILDLGCGTGSTTLMLKQTFPHAAITGVDLSPYMLVVADFKAQQAQLDIQWRQGLAEQTEMQTETFDLVTVCFLLHETPSHISQAILREGYRLLKPGGQLIVLDGHQRKLRSASWLIRLFREPYSQAYAAESVDTWMTKAQFEAVATRSVGWIDQITHGFKVE